MGVTLGVVALGAFVVLAVGHVVAPAFWAVGGVAMGILVGVLLPRPGTPSDQPISRARTQGPRRTDAEEDKPHAIRSLGDTSQLDALAASGDDGLTTAWRDTPLILFAAVAALGLTLSVLLYTGEIHRAGCQLGGLVRDPVCDQPLLDLGDVFIFIGSGAAGALLGLYMPQPPSPVSAVESRPVPDVGGEPAGMSTTPPGGVAQSGGTDVASARASVRAPEQAAIVPQLRGGLLAALVGVVLLLLVVVVLLGVFPRATADGARAFHISSLGLILAAAGFAAVATMRPAGKKIPWVLSAVVTAVLAFMSSTASGLVVDRFAGHSASPGSGVTVNNYVYPDAGTPPLTTVDAGSECIIYLAQLDDLVDDEPHIAERLPGKSFPLDQGARACGLKSVREMNEIAAALVAH